MSTKTPKTQNQWAGFQVRECNDYNMATGICHHEETPMNIRGGLLGHHFPNNICKYFHKGRDGTNPRTFKQNLADGLINMESIAEEILRQADVNIRINNPYGGAAVREVRSIMEQCSKYGSYHDTSQAYSLDQCELSAHEMRTLTCKKNYSTYLWYKMKEKGCFNTAQTLTHKEFLPPKQSSHPRVYSSEAARQVGHMSSALPRCSEGQESALLECFHELPETNNSVSQYSSNHASLNNRRKKTHSGWAGFQVRECDNYDQSTGICMHEETSCHHRGGLHGYSFPNNVCKYFHHGRDGFTPRTFEQNIAAGLTNIDSITDELYRQAYSSIVTNQKYDSAAIRQFRSLMNVDQLQRERTSCDPIDLSVGSKPYTVADADLHCKLMKSQYRNDCEWNRQKNDQMVDEDCIFEIVPIKICAESDGFISNVHFLKPPSSYQSSYYWSQLWQRDCDRYNARSDVCRYEELLSKSSFPEKACLHFHPGRNSSVMRSNVLRNPHGITREFVAGVLIADGITKASVPLFRDNPICTYIHGNHLTKATLIKNELPANFTVRTVDLPFRWNTVFESLPEVCFTTKVSCFHVNHLQPILRAFGYMIARCEMRKTAADEIQYFLWTKTRNGHYLKGIDSLFTISSGEFPSEGIVIGNATICPAEASVRTSDRLRFLLVDEVADYRVQINVPKGNSLFQKLDEIKFPIKWKFRCLLDEHKGVFRHILTRASSPEIPTIIRMNNHTMDHIWDDGSEYVLYDRQLTLKDLNLTSKSLLLYTPAHYTSADVAQLFHGIPEVRVMHYDRQRSLNLSLLSFYMRILKYFVQRKSEGVNEIQVILVGGRTVEKSVEINGIYKIFGASISRPLHRVVTIRLKNESTPNGYPRYTIGESEVPLSEVKVALESGHMGEIMDMVCITGPTLIDACVADLPTVLTLQDQTHLLDDPSRLIVLMSSEESWMHDLSVVQGLRRGSLENMLVLVRTRESRQQFRTLFNNQNIILFDWSDAAHARHYLRLFILSGIARHLTNVIGLSKDSEETGEKTDS